MKDGTFMETRYPDAPKGDEETTIEKGNWFQDYARDQLEKHWGISPKSYHSATYQLAKGEGRFAEFKHDPHTKHKHLSIEVGERAQARGPWVVSGIFRAKEPYYIQGDKNSFWVIPTHALRAYAKDRGIWYDWDDDKPHLSQLIDENGLVTTFGKKTMLRFFLEYDEARALGGIELKSK